MDLSKVSIGLRTFLRDPQLFNAIAAIRRTMPEVTLIIADCGEQTEEKNHLYDELSYDGHLCFTLPFDAGFGQMSNTIATAVTTPYLLIGSDDFDFNPPDVRQGIEKLVRALNDCPELSIVSGRVNNMAYEFFLDDQHNVVREQYADVSMPGPLVYYVDLTVNYSLFRKEVFKKCQWLDSVKIGGSDHGGMFIKYKRAGFKVGFVPEVNISEQKTGSSERYRQFRNRAKDPARPYLDELGVHKYILANGRLDYDAFTPSH